MRIVLIWCFIQVSWLLALLAVKKLVPTAQKIGGLLVDWRESIRLFVFVGPRIYQYPGCSLLLKKNQKSLCNVLPARVGRGTQRIVSVEYLLGRPVIASNFRLGKCHLGLS